MTTPEPESGDAFGLSLKACYDAGMKPGIASIIERDDGYIENEFDCSRYFAPIDDWDAIDRWAIDGLRGRVVDIGAGAGRATLVLQERGCDVIALDVSPACVEICQARGVTQTFLGDVEALAATGPEPFDAFVMLGNGLGLLRDAAYAPMLLAMLEKVAAPGSVIAGTCLDPYRSSMPEHLSYHERNRAAGRMAGQIRIRLRYRGVATPWWEYLFMSIDELRGLVAGSRWNVDDVLDSGALTYAVRMRLK